jgi:hypothetical protein
MFWQVRGAITAIAECNYSAREGLDNDLSDLCNAYGTMHIRQNGSAIGLPTLSLRQATAGRLAWLLSVERIRWPEGAAHSACGAFYNTLLALFNGVWGGIHQPGRHRH